MKRAIARRVARHFPWPNLIGGSRRARFWWRVYVQVETWAFDARQGT